MQSELSTPSEVSLGDCSDKECNDLVPGSEAAFRGADSSALLAEAARRVRAAGFEIVNLDSTVIAQAPKLAPHITAMVAQIAQTLGVAPGQVNVKAKTAERLGPVGQELSIEARAVVLLAAVPLDD